MHSASSSMRRSANVTRSPTSRGPRSQWISSAIHASIAVSKFALEQILDPVVHHRQHQGRAAQGRAARKVAVRNAGEEIKACGLGGEGFADQLAGDAGQG